MKNEELEDESKNLSIDSIETQPKEPLDSNNPNELSKSLIDEPQVSENNEINNQDLIDNNSEEINNLNELSTSKLNNGNEQVPTKNDETEILSKEKYHLNLSDGFIKENDFFQYNNLLSFREEVKSKYFCENCNRILWTPLKLKCGHIICETCKIISDSLENDNSLKCPIDEETMKTSETEICNIFKDNIWQLQVYCTSLLCEWYGSLNNLSNHFEICELKQIKCGECNEMIPWTNYEDHKVNICQMRPISCQYCLNSIFSKDLLAHEDKCNDKLIECPNNCKLLVDKTKTMILKQGILQFHLENACSERKIPCLFENFGCLKKTKHKKMIHHLTKYAIIHLDQICNYGKKNTESIEKQVRIMLELKEKLEKNGRKMSILNSELGTQLLWKIDNINDKYQEALVGKSAEIVSNNFYSTSPYGYKFIMRLIFNVHNVKLSNQYLSIYISICDSPFNVLLPWPFKLKMNIHLIDQTSDKHISHCFLPNPIVENYPFLNRPKTDRNPYFGIEKFSNCNIFHNKSPFTVGNTMFIKILIEPHDIV